MSSAKVTTGFVYLDEVIDSLRMGDNVVFQVNSIDTYRRFAQAFAQAHSQTGERLIYFRFAYHPALFDESATVHVYKIDAESGFETFTTQIHEIITREGRDVFYVFDCLSDLLDSWATDSMIANFFKLTCPYLYELNTIAYFATLRNRNSFQTVAAIRDTTQVLIDVYTAKDKTYVHPLKAERRYSSTMFLPHILKNSKLVPITSSGEAATLHARTAHFRAENPERHLDYWDRIFLKAAEQYEANQLSPQEQEQLTEKLAKVFLSRDPKFLQLLKEHFTLEDILSIKSRLIGSGYIGGKALGMLLARKIIVRQNPKWEELLEAHDSFYVGSDVYYSFLVENGLWKLKMKQRQPDHYFQSAAVLKERILQGQFSDRIKHEFLRMLEYFGQAPIIVRSSSLLEDGFGNAFAGKYESIFLINQGTLEERYAKLEEGIRRVFASTMDVNALTYRKQRGLWDKDEQMALLIQRVSGSHKQFYFFPDIGGVGFSYNTYVWDKKLDPQAGMIRLVSGLGTRAVNRLDGDYARLAALDKPLLKPYDGLQSFKPYTQNKLDLLNIMSNQLESVPLQKLINQKIDLKLEIVAERDREAERRIAELGLKQQERWVLTFDPLLAKTDFVQTMRDLLKTLEEIYAYPVDIEFTVNFDENGQYLINLLQCRPLQVQGLQSRVEFPKQLDPERIFFQSRGHFMGGNLAKKIDLLIYVQPQGYYRLKESQKYEVARSIGKLNRQLGKERQVMLIGPGRWGTSTPSLGVPVMFSEINHMDILVELGYNEASYAPELSFGTHFFQDLVESGIFYIALFPEHQGVVFRPEILGQHFEQKEMSASGLDLNPEIAHVLKIYDLASEQSSLQVLTDILEQKVLGYFCPLR